MKKDIQYYITTYEKIFTKILKKRKSNIYTVSLLQESIIKEGRKCGQKNIKGKGFNVVEAFEDALLQYPDKELLEDLIK